MTKHKQQPAIDDSVKIPPAVLAAAAAADALHSSVYVPAAEPPAEPPAELPAEPLTAPPAPAVVEPAIESPAPTPPSDQSWEHKYNSMKGRYERAESTIRQMGERLNGMEQVIATMAITAPLPPAAPPAELDISNMVTPAEREAYGDDFIAMATKIAKQQASPLVASLQEQVKNLTDRLEGVGGHIAQTELNRMHGYLTSNCPNWMQINEEPNFLAWLALPAPYSDATKMSILQAAYAANDGPRVLAFFKGFLAEEAASTPQPEPLPVPVVPGAKVPLETFAAPGRAKTAATPVPAEKPTFTRAQISQFYVDVAAKRYVGRETEKDRIDKLIVEAGRDGRIRP